MRNYYLAEFSFVVIGLDALVDANLRSVLPETKACRLLVRRSPDSKIPLQPPQRSIVRETKACVTL
jgi:hypothetical protein